MITSNNNPKIKWVRRIQSDRSYRHSENSFVVEGSRWIKELANLEYWPTLLLVAETWIQEVENQLLVENLPLAPLIISDQTMDHASSMETAPGVLAALSMPAASLPETPTLILILDQIANPGNLGSLLRSAAASGADGVILTPGCTDPFNPKALRGGMGAHLRVPFEYLNWLEIVRYIDSMAVFVASSQGNIPYYQVNWLRPSVIIIGSEASGPSVQAQSVTASEIAIPMKSGVDSLNAAAAGGIILFEAARQRQSLERKNQTPV